MTIIDIPFSPAPTPVDFLILGAGWISNFLIPLLKERKIAFAATSRSGHDKTLKFTFDPHSTNSGPFHILPNASTVLIAFPIYGAGGPKRLLEFYKETHPEAAPHFIQLGSTGIYDGSPTLQSEKKGVIWSDRHSSYNKSNSRAIAEDELLSLSAVAPATVLELCGLWGGERSMRNWVGRVAPTKDVLQGKVNSILHMVHGIDVARAILAVHDQFDKAAGSRWIVTDCRVYDWWDLASAWGDGGEANRDKTPTGHQPQWVRELMEEHNVRALPRSPETLGRALDSREFWAEFGISPVRARLEGD